VLGLPPVWYKSGPYRSRAVMAPRDVLRDFGVESLSVIAISSAYPIVARAKAVAMRHGR
jgi:hypothetical protein